MTDDSENKATQSSRSAANRNDKQGRLKDYSVILAATIVILGGIHCARGILGPIFIACFFAALLISPVRWLRSKGVAQWAALSVVIVGVLTIGLGTMTIVGSQLTQFAKNIPAYRDAFNEKLNNYNLNVDDFLPFLKNDEPKEDAKESAKDDLAFERFREYERERFQRDADSGSVENADDESERSEKRGDAKRSAEKASRSRNVVTKSSQEAEHFFDFNKTFAFSENVVPVAYRRLSDGAESTKIGVATESESESESDEGTTAVADGKTSKILGEKSVAKDSNDAETTGLLPPASDAESRLTPDGVEVDERLIPTQPEPLMSVGGSANGDDSTVAGLVASENVETDDETTPSEEKKDETDAVEDDFAPFEWRAGEGAVSAVNASSQELFRFLAGLVGELSYLASNAFIIMLLVIFMLCEGAAIPQKLVAALGKRRFTNAHIQSVADDIRNYMVIKTWMSVGVGVCVTILLIVSDVQYPLLWGFVAFLLNYIPNIGSVAAAIPPIVLATVEHGLFVGCVDAAFFVFINCFIGYVIEPRLLGNGLDLSPLIVLISLILFGWLLGPIGMFLSPPLAVIMKIVFQSFPETRWIAAMMANRPPKDFVADDEVSEAE